MKNKRNIFAKLIILSVTVAHNFRCMGFVMWMYVCGNQNHAENISIGDSFCSFICFKVRVVYAGAWHKIYSFCRKLKDSLVEVW